MRSWVPVAHRLLLRWRSRLRVTPGVSGLLSWKFTERVIGRSTIRHIRIVAARCVYPLDMRMPDYDRVGTAGS